MRKLACALALGASPLLGLTPAFANHATRQGHWLNMDSVVHIECGEYAGTGTVIGQRRVLTAEHVIHGAQSCTVDGVASRVISTDLVNDVAVLEADLPREAPIVPISCDVIAPGTYVGFGYGYGDFDAAYLTTKGDFGPGLKKVGSGESAHFEQARPSDTPDVVGMVVMNGDISPGMSGGPVLNAAGEIVATINIGGVGGFAMVRPLRDTALCVAFKTPTAPLQPVMDPELAALIKAAGITQVLPPVKK